MFCGEIWTVYLEYKNDKKTFLIFSSFVIFCVYFVMSYSNHSLETDRYESCDKERLQYHALLHQTS